MSILPAPIEIRAMDLKAHDIIVDAYAPHDAIIVSMVDAIEHDAYSNVLTLRTFQRGIYADGDVSRGGSYPRYVGRHATLKVWRAADVWGDK